MGFPGDRLDDLGAAAGTPRPALWIARPAALETALPRRPAIANAVLGGVALLVAIRHGLESPVSNAGVCSLGFGQARPWAGPRRRAVALRTLQPVRCVTHHRGHQPL